MSALASLGGRKLRGCPGTRNAHLHDLEKTHVSSHQRLPWPGLLTSVSIRRRGELMMAAGTQNSRVGSFNLSDVEGSRLICWSVSYSLFQRGLGRISSCSVKWRDSRWLHNVDGEKAGATGGWPKAGQSRAGLVAYRFEVERRRGRGLLVPQWRPTLNLYIVAFNVRAL